MNINHNAALLMTAFGLWAGVIATDLKADESEAITPEAVALGRPVDFNKDILPIFRANCLACHNRSKAEGELTLESTETILKGSSSGEIVVPGKPDESYLYQVAARVEESFMPPMPNTVQAKKLTPKQLGLLRQWIVEGAKKSSSTDSATINWQKINSQLTAIYSVDADPWGRFVAAGRAGNVTVYDLATANNIHTLNDPELKGLSAQQRAHRDYVHAIAFHPSGEMIATAGYQVVKLWERDYAASVRPIRDLGAIQRMVASPDGVLVAMQDDSGAVSVIDNNQKVVRKVAVEAGRKLYAIGGPENSQLLIGNADGTVSLVNADGSVAATSPAEQSPVTQAIFTNASSVVSCSEGGSIRRYTLNADAKQLVEAAAEKSDKGPIREVAIVGGSVMCRVEGAVVEIRNAENLQRTVLIQSSSPNRSAAISSNGERIVTVSPDGAAELWNAKDGKLIAALNKDLRATRQLQQADTDKAVRDARVTVVKAQITEAEKRVTEQKESLKKANEAVKKAKEALAAAKKKHEEEKPKVAAAQKASEAKADDAGLKKKLEDAQKAETAAKDAVAAAERGLASANKSVELTKQAIGRAEARVADEKKLLAAVEAEAKTSTEAQTKAKEASAATVSSSAAEFVSADLVATITGDGYLRLWKTTDGQPVDAFKAPVEKTAPLATLARSGHFFARYEKNTVAVNPFPAWKQSAALGNSKEPIFADRVLALTFSTDGKTLAAGGGEASRSGELTLWDVPGRKLIRRIGNAHSDTVCGVDISPDGKLLASAASDRFVKVFNLKTGEHVRNFEGHTHHVLDVSWKADGTRLVSAGGDNAIKVWNAETGEQTRTITTYQKQVTALEFIGMSNEFLSSSGDKRVFRHRADNGGTVREFKGCPDYVYCSCSAVDGAIIAAGCEDGVLRVWNGKDGKILSSFEPN